MRKLRKELGENKWAEYQALRKNLKALRCDIKKIRKVGSVIKWRRETKSKLVEYKGGKCQKCGYQGCLSAYDFHHIDPTKKELAISASSRSFETLKNEADKCMLVCRNCHAEIHDEMRENEVAREESFRLMLEREKRLSESVKKINKKGLGTHKQKILM